MVAWGLLTFVIGLVYGWVSPGRQNKSRLFMNGLVIGAVLAIILVVLGALANTSPLGLGNGIFALFLNVVILTLVFIIGTWIGDLIEAAVARNRRRTL